MTVYNAKDEMKGRKQNDSATRNLQGQQNIYNHLFTFKTLEKIRRFILTSPPPPF